MTNKFVTTRLLAPFLGVLAIAFSLIANPALAQNFPERGAAPVVDAANILSPVEEAEITSKLEEFEKRNQRQFVIATLPTLEGYDIADYGYQLGRHWALGDDKNNDGIILIIAPNERLMRIEVGYGLEGILPDGLAFEYVEEMKPYFRDGNYAGGAIHGANRIIAQLELPPEEAAQVAQKTIQVRKKKSGFPIGTIIWLAIIFFFFILPAIRGGRRRIYRGGGIGGAIGDIILWEAGKAMARSMNDHSSHSGGGSFGGFGGGGGFSGGGGGFFGGGGSFGGGGASGGW